jgi:hypothetical protein
MGQRSSGKQKRVEELKSVVCCMDCNIPPSRIMTEEKNPTSYLPSSMHELVVLQLSCVRIALCAMVV